LTEDNFKIALVEAGKKFSKEWVFRKLNSTFCLGDACAILGANGSGKSTLLQSILGFQTLTEGNLVILKNEKTVLIGDSYELFSFAAPYLSLYEDFTLLECFDFHIHLKPFFSAVSIEQEIKDANLWESRNKQVKNFSSGMKQRVKLMLAIFSDTPFLLLDEPCSNLDAKGIEWYQNKLTTWKKNRIIVIASNHIETEIFLCNKRLVIEDYKFSTTP
jgi:ABC-2 type transport system ATP-binding protein